MATFHDRYCTKVEGIGAVTVDTEWVPEHGSYATYIIVTRYDGHGRLCETRVCAEIVTDTPDQAHKHWTSDAVLMPYLVAKAATWPPAVYVPIPYTVHHGTHTEKGFL